MRRGDFQRREDFQTRNGMPRLKTSHLKTNFRRRNEDSSNEINAESVAVREESPGPVVIQGSIRGMGRGRKKNYKGHDGSPDKDDPQGCP